MGFGILTREDREAIHRTSARLLWQVGVEVDSPEVPGRLAEGEVGPERRRARLPEDLVWRSVRKCPSGILLADFRGREGSR